MICLKLLRSMVFTLVLLFPFAIGANNEYLGRSVQHSYLPADNTPYFGVHLCYQPDYRCFRTTAHMSWESMFPDKRIRQMVMRLNRTNLAMNKRPWVVVPENAQSKTYMDLNPLENTYPTNGRRVLMISLKEHAFTAYNALGIAVHWGPISAGRSFCKDMNAPCETIVGDFSMFRKDDASCFSRTFPIGKGGALMPWCMFFYGGYAIHGAVLPGYNASHGCVRVFLEDAQWLNEVFVHTGGRAQTHVSVLPG